MSSTRRKMAGAAQAKAPANQPQAIAAYPPSTSRSSAGTLSPEPGTYRSGGARPATPAGTAFPAASLTAVLPAPNTMSATTGCCPTIGAPHREQTRAATATSAAHSRHLIGTHPADTHGTLAGYTTPRGHSDR